PAHDGRGARDPGRARAAGVRTARRARGAAARRGDGTLPDAEARGAGERGRVALLPALDGQAPGRLPVEPGERPGGAAPGGHGAPERGGHLEPARPGGVLARDDGGRDRPVHHGTRPGAGEGGGMTARPIDLNCDMGESYGRWTLGADAEIMPFITSANIAAGFHGGDPHVMRTTVELALRHGVAIGAHPGLPDLMGFGRRRMDVNPQEVRDYMVYQTGALREVVTLAGAALQHVKPHGILYNMMEADEELAEAAGAASIAMKLILMVAASGTFEARCRKMGARVAGEGFADRAYQVDGRLVSRKVAGSLITDPRAAAAQAAAAAGCAAAPLPSMRPLSRQGAQELAWDSRTCAWAAEDASGYWADLSPEENAIMGAFTWGPVRARSLVAPVPVATPEAV